MVHVVTLLVALVYVAITYVAFRAYRTTRNRGFLILGFAVLVWPILAILMDTGLGAEMQQVLAGNLNASLLSRALNRGYSLGDVLALWTNIYRFVNGALILLGLITIYRTMPRSTGLNPHPKSH